MDFRLRERLEPGDLGRIQSGRHARLRSFSPCPADSGGPSTFLGLFDQQTELAEGRLAKTRGQVLSESRPPGSRASFPFGRSTGNLLESKRSQGIIVCL